MGGRKGNLSSWDPDWRKEFNPSVNSEEKETEDEAMDKSEPLVQDLFNADIGNDGKETFESARTGVTCCRCEGGGGGGATRAVDGEGRAVAAASTAAVASSASGWRCRVRRRFSDR